MTSADRHLQRERGFTVLELVIVLIIVAILMIAAIVAMRSARLTAANESMATAGSSVDQAIGNFNRIYPPVPAANSSSSAIVDQLVSRAAGQVWTGNIGNPNNGLTDETGEWLLAEWPKNPYAPGGVRVTRYAASASCNAGQPGEVRVCRTPAEGRMTYRITAWGKDRNGNPKIVFRASHGTS